MKLYSIDAGTFISDGGALFGVVPKVLWRKRFSTDENNLCTLTMRNLLVCFDDRKVLIDTGAGTKQPEKYRQNNGLSGNNLLLESLSKIGVVPEEITDVVLTHLHWDHCGGCTCIDENGILQFTFPNAMHYVGKAQYENALNPNPREAAAYFNDDFMPLANTQKLTFVSEEITIHNNIKLRLFYGHTPGMIIPYIYSPKGTYIFTADLLPVAASLPVVWVPAFDSYPVTTMKEKEAFLREVADNNFILFFQHDITTECATIEWTGKHPSIVKKFTLHD